MGVSYLNRHFVLDWRSGYNLGFESIINIMQQNGYAMSEQYGDSWRGSRAVFVCVCVFHVAVCCWGESEEELLIISCQHLKSILIIDCIKETDGAFRCEQDSQC